LVWNEDNGGIARGLLEVPARGGVQKLKIGIASAAGKGKVTAKNDVSRAKKGESWVFCEGEHREVFHKCQKPPPITRRMKKDLRIREGVKRSELKRKLSRGENRHPSGGLLSGGSTKMGGYTARGGGGRGGGGGGGGLDRRGFSRGGALGRPKTAKDKRGSGKIDCDQVGRETGATL